MPVLIQVESHPQLAPGQPVELSPHPTHPQPYKGKSFTPHLCSSSTVGICAQCRDACVTSHNMQHTALPLPRGCHLHTTCGQFHTDLRMVQRCCSFLLCGTYINVCYLTTLQIVIRAQLCGPIERPSPAGCKNDICGLQICGLRMCETSALPSP